MQINLGGSGRAGVTGWWVILSLLPLLVFCFSVKAATLAFYSIQLLFITDIHATFSIPNLPKPLHIGQNPGEGISDFRSILFKRKLS